jgi:hypothetical protein
MTIILLAFAFITSADCQDQRQIDDERKSPETTRVNQRMMRIAAKREGGPPHNRWGGILGKRDF